MSVFSDLRVSDGEGGAGAGLQDRAFDRLIRLVLVRFSVGGPISFRVKTASGGPAHRDPAWLAERERLFDLYCRPSLDRQIDRGFTTLLFFDRETDPQLIGRLTDGERIVALLTGEGLSMNSAVNAYLRTRLESALRSDGGTFVATTRLDSDDAIAPGFMAKLDAAIRSAADGIAAHGRGYFCFPLGQKYLAEKDRYRRIYWPKNAFGTLVERWRPKGIDTVFARRHARMVKEERTVLIDDGSGYWCVVIHGGNVSNDARRSTALATPYFPVVPPAPAVRPSGRLARFLRLA